MEKNIEKGVSLIELILAIGVFVVGSAAVAHLFIGSQFSMNYSLERMQAIFLAKEGIENVRAIKNENFNEVFIGTEKESIVLNDKDFERIITTSLYHPDRINVISFVQWKSIGREESISQFEFLSKWDEINEEN